MFTLSTDRGALCRARGLACLEGRLALPRRRPLVRVAIRVVAEGGARLRRLLRRRGHAAACGGPGRRDQNYGLGEGLPSAFPIARGWVGRAGLAMGARARWDLN